MMRPLCFYFPYLFCIFIYYFSEHDKNNFHIAKEPQLGELDFASQGCCSPDSLFWQGN